MHTSRNGFLLITTLMVISGLLMLSAISMTRSATDLLVANRFVANQQAYAQAEAGLDCAIKTLRQTTTVGTACNQVNAVGAAVRTVTVIPPVVVGICTVSSTGTAGTSTTSTVTAKVMRAASSPFQQAIFATSAINGNVSDTQAIYLSYNSLLDSYDSRLGNYGDALSSTDPNYNLLNQSQDGRPSSQHADLATNSSLNGASKAMVIAGSTKIMGKASTPIGGSGVVIGVGSTLTQGTAAQSVQAYPQPIIPTAPATCINIPSASITTDYSTDPAQSIYLTGSSFCATDVTIDAGGKLSLPELSFLNVTGTITVKNGGQLELGQQGTGNPATVVVRKMWVNTGGSVKVIENGGPVDIYAQSLIAQDPTTVIQGYKDPAIDPSTPNRIHPETLRTYVEVVPPFDYLSVVAQLLNGVKYYGVIYSTNHSVALFTNDINHTKPHPELYGAIVGTNCMTGYALIVDLHYDEALKQMQNWPSWMPVTVTLLAEYQ